MLPRLVPALFLASVLHATPPQRPFPQHVPYAKGTILPSGNRAQLDTAVASVYDAWKARYLHDGCQPGQAYVAYNLEQKAEEKDAISSSEGHGYGMLLCAFMAGHDPGAQAAFDALFAFFHAHPSGLQHSLMAWQQVTGCVSRPGNDDSASDGDLDIAYALLLADRQWGSSGAIHYRGEALKLLAAIKAAEINVSAATVKLGDWADEGEAANDIRLSDFMPDHFRAFSRATGDPVWDRLIEHGYAGLAWLQSKYAPTTGLPPDFARGAQSGTPTPAPKKFLESKYDGHYFYNACRLPWRVGIDGLIAGDPRAHAALGRINAFIAEATKENPDEIHAGYYLDGKVIDDKDSSLAYTGPFGVGAMVESSRQHWLDLLSHRLLQKPDEDDDYYGRTIALLSLIAISGNWWSP